MRFKCSACTVSGGFSSVLDDQLETLKLSQNVSIRVNGSYIVQYVMKWTSDVSKFYSMPYCIFAGETPVTLLNCAR